MGAAGSTQGIGFGMLQGLAKAGADVVMHGLIAPEEAQRRTSAVEDEFGVKCAHSAANVMKPAEIRCDGHPIPRELPVRHLACFIQSAAHQDLGGTIALSTALGWQCIERQSRTKL